MAQLFTDVRTLNAKAIDEFESPSMPPAVSAFLAQDAEVQRAIRGLRHYDTAVDMWIQSEVVGPTAAPDRVNVEVAGVLVSEPMEFWAWHRDRFDVVWEGDRWKLIGFAGGAYGPDGDKSLTRAQQREFLTGPGWRRIPASG